MAAKPKSLSEAREQARQLVAEAVLQDPNSHFPYKREVVDRLVTTNPAMGPGGPSDGSVRAEDFMSPRIAEASDHYVQAQEAFLRDPSAANQELYRMASEDLVAARRSHRRSRVDADGNPSLNITASTNEGGQNHLRGPRFRRPGEE